MRKCCVEGCFSNRGKPYVPTFLFPKDEVRRRLWAKSVGQNESKITGSIGVCIKHFSEECAIRYDKVSSGAGFTQSIRKKIKLKSSAVPSLYLSSACPAPPTHPSFNQSHIMANLEDSVAKGVHQRRQRQRKTAGLARKRSSVYDGDFEPALLRTLLQKPNPPKRPFITLLKAEEENSNSGSPDNDDVEVVDVTSPVTPGRRSSRYGEMSFSQSSNYRQRDEDNVSLGIGSSFDRRSSVGSNSSNGSLESIGGKPPVSLISKRRKQERPPPTVTGRKNDCYCWICHKEGIVLSCFACPRAYHLRCAGESENSEDWVCMECRKMMASELNDSQSKTLASLSLEQFCMLLKCCVSRMKSRSPAAFHQPVPVALYSSYLDYVIKPMDLSFIEKNIKQKLYGGTESFLSDVKWIQHNSFVFNGAGHPLSQNSRALVKTCESDMAEIEVCPDCYLHAYNRNINWFSEVCREPHPVVWAKLKGFPYWPAKVVRIVDDNVDARFFGAHDRAWVPVCQCFHLSKEMPTTSRPKKKGTYDTALEELEIHVQLLKQKFGVFVYAPYRTPFDPTNKIFMYHGIDIECLSKPEEEEDSSCLPSSSSENPALSTLEELKPPSTLSTNAIKKVDDGLDEEEDDDEDEPLAKKFCSQRSESSSLSITPTSVDTEIKDVIKSESEPVPEISEVENQLEEEVMPKIEKDTSEPMSPASPETPTTHPDLQSLDQLKYSIDLITEMVSSNVEKTEEPCVKKEEEHKEISKSPTKEHPEETADAEMSVSEKIEDSSTEETKQTDSNEIKASMPVVVAKKDDIFSRKLDEVIKSCKAKLGIEDVEVDESSESSEEHSSSESEDSDSASSDEVEDEEEEADSDKEELKSKNSSSEVEMESEEVKNDGDVTTNKTDVDSVRRVLFEESSTIEKDKTQETVSASLINEDVIESSGTVDAGKDDNTCSSDGQLPIKDTVMDVQEQSKSEEIDEAMDVDNFKEADCSKPNELENPSIDNSMAKNSTLEKEELHDVDMNKEEHDVEEKEHDVEDKNTEVHDVEDKDKEMHDVEDKDKEMHDVEDKDKVEHDVDKYKDSENEVEILVNTIEKVSPCEEKSGDLKSADVPTDTDVLADPKPPARNANVIDIIDISSDSETELPNVKSEPEIGKSSMKTGKDSEMKDVCIDISSDSFADTVKAQNNDNNTTPSVSFSNCLDKDDTDNQCVKSRTPPPMVDETSAKRQKLSDDMMVPILSLDDITIFKTDGDVGEPQPLPTKSTENVSSLNESTEEEKHDVILLDQEPSPIKCAVATEVMPESASGANVTAIEDSEVPVAEPKPSVAVNNSEISPIKVELIGRNETVLDEDAMKKITKQEKEIKVLKQLLHTLKYKCVKREWYHKQEIFESHHNMNLMLSEIRTSLDLRKKQTVERLEKEFKEKISAAVLDAKGKQWCSHCKKPSIFYCCWNTTYCSYTCQKLEWHRHRFTCAQMKTPPPLHSNSPEVIKVAKDTGFTEAVATSADKRVILLMNPPDHSQQSLPSIVSATGNVYSTSQPSVKFVSSENSLPILTSTAIPSSSSHSQPFVSTVPLQFVIAPVNPTVEVANCSSSSVVSTTVQDSSEIIDKFHSRQTDLSTAISMLNQMNKETEEMMKKKQDDDSMGDSLVISLPALESQEPEDSFSSQVTDVSSTADGFLVEDEVVAVKKDNKDSVGPKVSLGKGVTINEKLLKQCVDVGTTATKLVRCLMSALFSPMEMAKCSAFGRKSNITKITRPALSMDTVDAILNFIHKIFPNAPRTDLVLAMNLKCKEVRKKLLFENHSPLLLYEQTLEAQSAKEVLIASEPSNKTSPSKTSNTVVVPTTVQPFTTKGSITLQLPKTMGPSIRNIVPMKLLTGNVKPLPLSGNKPASHMFGRFASPTVARPPVAIRPKPTIITAERCSPTPPLTSTDVQVTQASKPAAPVVVAADSQTAPVMQHTEQDVLSCNSDLGLDTKPQGNKKLRAYKRKRDMGLSSAVLQKAASLCIEEGRSVRSVAREFQLCHVTLLRYVKKIRNTLERDILVHQEY